MSFKSKTIFLAIFLFYFSVNFFAVNFGGSYKMTSGNVQLFLYVKQDGNKVNAGLTGTTGANFKLNGVLQKDYVFGKCYGENLQVFFNMYFEGDELYLQLIEPGKDGKPDWSKIKELVFKRSGGSSGNIPENRTPQSQNPLSNSGISKNFSGTFSGNNILIRLSQSGNSVSGILKYGNNTYNIKGKVSGNFLKGSFYSRGGSYNFIARVSGNDLIFETAGTTYHLARKNSSNPLSKNSNPLAKGKSSNNYRRIPDGGSGGNGKRISVESMGLSFRVPTGWIAKKDPNSGNYIMGSNSIPGIILMFPHNYKNINELVAASSEGFNSKGINLRASSDIEKISENAIGTEFSGIFQNVQAKAYVIGILSPKGGGFLAMCITKADKYTSLHKRSAIELAKSVRFFTPKVDSSLMNWIAGEYYSYVGHTERKLMLCPNGTYYYSDESSYSGELSGGGAWGNAAESGDRGTWRITGNRQRGTIIFTSSKDGGSSERPYVVGGKGLIYIDQVKFGYKGPANCN